MIKEFKSQSARIVAFQNLEVRRRKSYERYVHELKDLDEDERLLKLVPGCKHSYDEEGKIRAYTFHYEDGYECKFCGDK